jgi:hypothetical protein
MHTGRSILPEDLLVATISRVGGPLRLKDDVLARVLNDVAASHPESAFGPFKWHPLYHYSRLLGDTLQNLDHAGSIVRENASQSYFKASDHTLGPYGQRLYENMDNEGKALIDKVADQIRRAFKAA